MSPQEHQINTNATNIDQSLQNMGSPIPTFTPASSVKDQIRDGDKATVDEQRKTIAYLDGIKTT